MDAPEAYQWLVNYSRETAYLKSIRSLLAWDQRTQIPMKGHAHRANQLAMLARWIHERETNPELEEKLAAVAGSPLVADPLGVEAVNVREWRRAYERARKIPRELAVSLARAAAVGQTAWEQTRPHSDWQTFQPYLEQIVALKREEAQAKGYDQEPYDALLDDYEPGETAAALEPIFAQVRQALIKLWQAIQGSSRRPDTAILRRHFPRAAQERFSRYVAERLGYDFDGGRLDPTAHPFATGIGPGDVRITTRYDEQCFSLAFFSTLHEAGHALYHQGLPEEHWGTPRGQPISLGIHESQSRLWENFAGRSLGFWRGFFPVAQDYFPALTETDLTAFHFAINEVRPDLIRTEADEVTYNLHILLRFQLERALLQGDLKVADLPGAWNEKMQAYLGLTPPNAGAGVMQDVHWAAGHMGYFPTYTLGNLYAAQFYAQGEKELGDLPEMFAQGAFAPLLNWLRRQIHLQGKRYWPRHLVEVVTGERLNSQYLIRYLQGKFGSLYGLSLGGTGILSKD